jgi:transcriptional regulator with XRE-family HTH domain
MVEQLHGHRLHKPHDAGAVLRQRREHAGLTLRALSGRSGLAHSSLGRWESNGAMTACSFFAWAHSLGLDVALVPRRPAAEGRAAR